MQERGEDRRKKESKGHFIKRPYGDRIVVVKNRRSGPRRKVLDLMDAEGKTIR